MAALFTQAFLYLRYWILVNKEVVMQNEGGIHYSQEMYYENSTADTFSLASNSADSKVAPEKIMKHCIIFPSMQGDIPTNEDTLFVFLYDNKVSFGDILQKHEKIVFDPKIAKIIIEKTTLQIIFNNLELKAPSADLHFEVKERTKLANTMMHILLLFGMVFASNILCKKIIDKMSANDPVYSDFVIASANIQKFKDIQQKAESNCTICYEEFTGEDEVRVLPCNHFYHPDCIDRWLIGHSKCCPYCRKDIEIVEKI